MNTTLITPILLLASSCLMVACTPGGGQSMPMAATPAGQSNQADLRDPTARDPGLHVDHAASEPEAPGAQSSAAEGDNDDMAAEMKDLGDRISAMGMKMQNMKADSKMVKGKQPASGGMGDMDPAKMKAIGAQMKEMGAKMRSKAQAMKGDAGATKPAAGGMGSMDPGKMMKMGDEMMAMGSQMMDMGSDSGAAEPAKMKQMGDHMMDMGGDMGGMGKPKGGAMKKPMAPPAAPPTPAQPPAASPMPPMQDM